MLFSLFDSKTTLRKLSSDENNSDDYAVFTHMISFGNFDVVVIFSLLLNPLRVLEFSQMFCIYDRRYHI